MTDHPTAAELAQTFHETYERLAPSFSYVTRKRSAVRWDDVPQKNKSLMIAVAEELLAVGSLAELVRRADEAHRLRGRVEVLRKEKQRLWEAVAKSHEARAALSEGER